MDEELKAKWRRQYADIMIRTSQYVVCPCGRLFHDPDSYVAHVASCEAVARSEAAVGRFSQD